MSSKFTQATMGYLALLALFYLVKFTKSQAGEDLIDTFYKNVDKLENLQPGPETVKFTEFDAVPNNQNKFDKIYAMFEHKFEDNNESPTAKSEVLEPRKKSEGEAEVSSESEESKERQEHDGYSENLPEALPLVYRQQQNYVTPINNLTNSNFRIVYDYPKKTENQENYPNYYQIQQVHANSHKFSQQQGKKPYYFGKEYLGNYGGQKGFVSKPKKTIQDYKQQSGQKKYNQPIQQPTLIIQKTTRYF